MWPEAVKSSRYDLEKDPVYTNNAVFPCSNESFSWDLVSFFKNLKINMDADIGSG